jgi:hypothetical protein
MPMRCHSILQELSKDEGMDLGSLGCPKNKHFFAFVKSKGSFFQTEEEFLIYASGILLSELLWSELEIQLPLLKRRKDSGLKLPKEKNSSMAAGPGIPVTPARKKLSHFASGTDSRSTPGHQAIFSSLEQFLNDNWFAQASAYKQASISTVNPCGTSVRNSDQYRHMHKSLYLKLTEAVPGWTKR